jgi:hypothetical protein
VWVTCTLHPDRVFVAAEASGHEHRLTMKTPTATAVALRLYDEGTFRPVDIGLLLQLAIEFSNLSFYFKSAAGHEA